MAKGKTTVEVAGQVRTVRFPVSALIKLKKEAGIKLSDLQDEERVQDIETIVAIIWAGLVTDDPSLTMDELADSIELNELSEIAQKVMSVINDQAKKD